MKQDPHHICSICADKNRRVKNIDDNVQIKVKADVMMDCVKDFRYLGDKIGARGGRRKRVEIE